MKYNEVQNVFESTMKYNEVQLEIKSTMKYNFSKEAWKNNSTRTRDPTDFRRFWFGANKKHRLYFDRPQRMWENRDVGSYPRYLSFQKELGRRQAFSIQ